MRLTAQDCRYLKASTLHSKRRMWTGLVQRHKAVRDLISPSARDEPAPLSYSSSCHWIFFVSFNCARSGALIQRNRQQKAHARYTVEQSPLTINDPCPRHICMHEFTLLLAHGPRAAPAFDLNHGSCFSSTPRPERQPLRCPLHRVPAPSYIWE
jgi:hypothetical protein